MSRATEALYILNHSYEEIQRNRHLITSLSEEEVVRLRTVQRKMLNNNVTPK